MKVKRPTLLLDQKKCRNNIRMMGKKAAKYDLFFRPHFKTHQSLEIGNWFREKKVKAITVSSVRMAEYFACDGWNDITIAFPFNKLEIIEINSLNNRISLNLLLQELNSVDFLSQHLKNEAGVFIEIDNGYHRSGIGVDNIFKIQKILNRIESTNKLEFKGFLTHAGNTYQTKSPEEVITIHQQTKQQLFQLKEKFLTTNSELITSIGDTPSCCLANDFNGIDEIRPGNFVFFDLMQVLLGSCNYEQIAMIVACPVVAGNSDRKEIIIYGGAVHLAKEYVTFEGNTCYGLVVYLTDSEWSEPLERTYVSELSQEHGIIKTTEKIYQQIIKQDVIGIIPVHSCLTANLMSYYRTLEGLKITRLS